MDSVDLEDELHDHDGRVQRHGVEWAEEKLRTKSPDIAELVIATYRERIGEPLHTRGLVSTDHEGWYLPKPDHESPRWAFAKTRLGLPDDIVKATSKAADEILARLANPSGTSIETRGLVLGHVQSGKTTSFLSVAAKAADNGYDLIIVLAGVHNSLRRQTQNRAVRTLVHKDELWWLGTAMGDFSSDGNSLSSHLAGAGKRGLLVVKKHATILERLADWLEQECSHDSLRRRAILVIDDEADQAGLDVSTSGELEGVHKQLRRIVDLKTSDEHRRCAYLAYTATPYANILTSQDNFGLYPRDFIYPLDKPSAYVGSAELFGDDRIGDPVQIESDDSDEIALTAALEDAIRWFVLATAARAAIGEPLESFHSSMLIHTTQLTDDQLEYRPLVEQFLQGLASSLESDPAVLQEFYEQTLAQVPAQPGGGEGFIDEVAAPWTRVRPHVATVLARLLDRTPAGPQFKEDGRTQQAHSGVIVDNSHVEWRDRLTYSDLAAGQPSVTVIAIGGNTLSRGLTLEGLVCSYFARTARTYDSLMQMCRWFGYRPGYRHLLRVWTTVELFNWFRELDVVEQELRQELLWMQEEGLPPSEYGPRIRVSPNMNITRAAAMRSISRHVSYSDTEIDPAWLALDGDTIAHNQRHIREFAAGLDRWKDPHRPRTYLGVPLDVVEGLLTTFRFHPEERRIDMPSLQRYLAAEASGLASWNVVFKSVATNSEPFDFGGSVGPVTPVVRAQLGPGQGYIQSIVDSSDHRADLNGSPVPGDARYRARGEPPLLTVYAVDPTSEPLRKGKREALNAPSHPIGLSLVFPESGSQVEYVAPAVNANDPNMCPPDLGDYHND